MEKGSVALIHGCMDWSGFKPHLLSGQEAKGADTWEELHDLRQHLSEATTGLQQLSQELQMKVSQLQRIIQLINKYDAKLKDLMLNWICLKG